MCKIVLSETGEEIKSAICIPFSHFELNLFQKRVVRRKVDIYVFITITELIPLLVDY
jgi:hypothetical protein